MKAERLILLLTHWVCTSEASAQRVDPHIWLMKKYARRFAET
jgi:hypothetical protein